ncbi:MAG: methionine--tRNA ligase subunit beta, partial [Thermoanaerobaculia bacterium]
IESFGTDSLRYFLLREMVFGQDASFSDEAFIDRYNSDLANDLGNTTSRLVTLSRRAFDGCLPPSSGDSPLAENAAAAVAEYRDAMDRYAFNRALESLWKLLAAANQYLVANEPWKRLQDADAGSEIATVLWNALEAVRVVASGLVPFLPEKSQQVLAAIGAPPVEGLDALEWGRLPTGAELPALAPIFPRIDKKKYLRDAGRPAPPPAAAAAEDREGRLSIDQFLEIELRVATVKTAAAVPKSKKLLKLSVDLGEGVPRTLVAGIAHSYAPEDLVGRQVVVVANLEPAKLMGVESSGMVLAATAAGKPVLLRPDSPVPDGTRVK